MRASRPAYETARRSAARASSHAASRMPSLLLISETAGAPSPLLHVFPGPQQDARPPDERFWEFRVTSAPVVHHLCPLHAETLSDVGGGDEVVHFDPSPHWAGSYRRDSLRIYVRISSAALLRTQLRDRHEDSRRPRTTGPDRLNDNRTEDQLWLTRSGFANTRHERRN
jgi:hypothetical protein